MAGHPGSATCNNHGPPTARISIRGPYDDTIGPRNSFVRGFWQSISVAPADNPRSTTMWPADRWPPSRLALFGVTGIQPWRCSRRQRPALTRQWNACCPPRLRADGSHTCHSRSLSGSPGNVIGCLTAFRSDRKLTIVSDGAFFGRRQFDMGNLCVGDRIPWR